MSRLPIYRCQLAANGAECLSDDLSYRHALEAAKRDIVVKALVHTNGNHAAAARVLGLHKTHLLDLIKTSGLNEVHKQPFQSFQGSIVPGVNRSMALDHRNVLNVLNCLNGLNKAVNWNGWNDWNLRNSPIAPAHFTFKICCGYLFGTGTPGRSVFSS